MSLVAIKQYMVRARMASLTSLCQLFNTEPETMRCLLNHWMQKGNIRQCIKKPACGSKCFKCPTATTELYEWVENPANQSVGALTCF